MAPSLVLPMRHGLQLTVTGLPTLQALGSFLNAALIHFKNQRDIQASARYTAGSFQGRGFAISSPGDSHGQYLSPAAWAESVLEVQANVRILRQMLATPAVASEAARDRISDVVVALERGTAADHLAALRLLLERSNPGADRPAAP